MDDDGVDTSINHDLLMMGEAPDNDDNGGDLGREELFGSSASAPAGVAAGGEGGAEAAADARRTRSSTSGVWDDFEKVYKTVNGKKVRFAAICNWCKKELSARSSSGTGHLLRHQLNCKVRKQKTVGVQSILQFNPDGSVRNWDYSLEVARTQMVRLIAREDLPLSFAESRAFEEYIKLAHNPKYVSSSRQTATRDIAKYFHDCRSLIMETLKSAYSIAITSDIWSGNAKEDYLSVVAHFVDKDWQLEKRIIGLRLIDENHNAANIAERIASVVSEFECSDKVISVTLDNASANSRAMDHLSPVISGYVGTLFLHQRCACHIINLIVKSGLKRFGHYVDDFRKAISFLNSSNLRIAAYKSYCVATGVRPRKFGLDMDVRWNATYLMLKHLLPHKKSFSVFMHTQYPRKDGEPDLLTSIHWYVAEKILEFLELFYDATVSLSGVYYPTSPLMMHNLLDIISHLSKYENDEFLRHAVVPMKSKYLKYWRDIPMLYSFAFILDPRGKLRGFSNILRLLSLHTGTDYTPYFASVKDNLKRMFDKYDAKFGSLRQQRPIASRPATGKRKQNWGLIYGNDVVGGFGSCPDLARNTSASALLQAASSSGGLASLNTELSSYLDSDCEQKFDDDFNLLSWWHERKMTYPVLSILARDVIAVPVSTISSESCFSLCGRIIEDRRRRLGPDLVEQLLCIKDWELGDARAQHCVKNLELEASFEDLYLDDE